MKHPSLCFFLFSFLNINYIFSQPAPADSSYYKSALNHIIQLYTDSLKENIRLYNGTEFTAAFRSSYGHPFFETIEPQKGGIFYEDVFYNNVSLHYELIHDEVIFVTPGNNLNIKLITQKIGWFTLPGHLFVNVSTEDVVGLPASGFYELVDKNPYSVLIKRKKQLYQPPGAEESSKFILINDYYLKKDSVCYHVNSRRSLLAFCRDQRSQVSRFLQEQKLDFKRDPENTILKAIDFYSRLKN
jgi:hypothetical protein